MALGPTQSFTKDNVKVRWMERYTSDSINKKFLGIPRGIYLGFIPSQSGLVLTLKTDTVVTVVNVSGSFAIGDVLVGGTSAATATVRVVTLGYLLVDNVVGTFQIGETVTAGLTTAIVGDYRSEAISFGRVVSATALVPGRSEDMVDVVTGDPVALNFTGFPDGTYHVILTASYQVGQVTSAAILTRTTPPANGASEVLVCQVTKSGGSLSVAATAPTTRHEPFAYEGTRIGFMPGGSIEQLLNAALASQEVVASRRRSDGVTTAAFDPGLPQTTGLPARLNNDLSGPSMSTRLGKSLVELRGNDFTLAAPANSAIVSGSFSARNRDYEPYRDTTSLTIPAGVRTAIPADGSDLIALNLSAVGGAFATSTQLVGATSGATGIIRIIDGTTLYLSDVVGVFFVGETVAVGGGPPSGTLDSVDLLEGAITSQDPPVATSDAVRNVVAIVNSLDGRRVITTAGLVVFGRLFYGPDGLTGGEFSLTGTLNFTNGSPGVGGAGTLFTTEISNGDIIEGADGRFYEVLNVTSNTTLTLSDPYVGANGAAGARRRRRFIVKFFTKSGGTETQVSIAAGTYEIYFPAWLLLERSNANYSLSRKTPEAQPVGVRGEKNGAGTTSLLDIVNFIEGTNIAITVVESGGKINVTVTNTFVGGASFPGFGGTPPADSGGGSAGASGLASRSDHQHPVSSAYKPASYTIRAGIGFATAPVGASANFPTGGMTPKFAIFYSGNNGITASIGFAVGAANNEQVVTDAGYAGGGTTPPVQGHIVNLGTGAIRYNVSSFGDPISVTRSVGSDLNSGMMVGFIGE